MRQFFLDKVLKIKYLLCGIRTIKMLHLMDDVSYNGKTYFINNMITSCGNCGARLIDILPNEWSINAGGEKFRKSEKVAEWKLKKIKNWKNFKNGLFSNYSWQMAYWHRITMDKMLNK